MQEDSIDAGIVLTDEDEYFSEYPHLIGENVEMKVDRISIEFLRESV
ncbi:CDS_ID OB3362 [Bacillus subtilis]|nr:CDS_ID OB3362 [Bacillus subtilis]